MSPVSLICHNEGEGGLVSRWRSEAMHYWPLLTTLSLSISQTQDSFQGLTVNKNENIKLFWYFIHEFFFPRVWDWWHLMTVWMEIGNEWDRSQQTVYIYWGIDGHQSGNVRMWVSQYCAMSQLHQVLLPHWSDSANTGFWLADGYIIQMLVKTNSA